MNGNRTTMHAGVAALLGLLRLMRPKQWVKNGFVFAPLVFSGQFLNGPAVGQTLLAALLFCVASSATYVVNDMRDVEDDRRHPKKSGRPLASGVVSMAAARAFLVLLYGILVAGWFVQPATVLIIVAYLALNIAYTYALKQQPVVDLFAIAIGFVLRVAAGAQALDVPVSSWMFITTLCVALYLAAIKRRQELKHRGSTSRKVLDTYTVSLIDRYAEISATGALVFYSMFVLSEQPELVTSIPLVLFGIFRYWFVVDALDGGESPTDALLSDWQLLGVVLIWIAACVWALWPV